MSNFIKLGELRDLEEQVTKGQITYSKMVEMINMLAALHYKGTTSCDHMVITIVTETPTDGTKFQEPKKWVECSKCKQHLPISLILKEERTTSLYPDCDN